MATRYEIRKGETAPCMLVSMTKLANWPETEKFITEGTHTYCKRILDEIESARNR